MHIHFLQHVDFEEPALILDWANANNFTTSYTKIFNQDSFVIHDFDVLCILGGPMSVYEEHIHPWLVDEKQFILNAIGKNKKVLGICLGAQLIADVLGAKVYAGPHKEIGWWNISKNADNQMLKEFDEVFHWHGDTFTLPEGAIHLASSKAFENQAFIYEDNVLALQFHIEMNEKSIRNIIANCSGELISDSYVQSEIDILSKLSNVQTLQYKLFKLLDRFILDKFIQ